MQITSIRPGNRVMTGGSAKGAEQLEMAERQRFARNARTIGWRNRLGYVNSVCDRRKKRLRSFLRYCILISELSLRTYAYSSRVTEDTTYTCTRHSFKSWARKREGR